MSKIIKKQTPKQLAAKIISEVQSQKICSRVEPSVSFGSVVSLKITLTTGERIMIIINEEGYEPRFLVVSVDDFDLEKRFNRYKTVVRFLKGRL